jgi:hypothetical protein
MGGKIPSFKVKMDEKGSHEHPYPPLKMSESALILQRKDWEGNPKIQNRTVDILILNGIKWQPVGRQE